MASFGIRMKLQAIFVASVLVLSGCASGPPQPILFAATPAAVLAPPPADKAQLIFVMPKNLFVDTSVVELYDLGPTEDTSTAAVPS